MPQAKPRTIELLAPARDLGTALDAISHGADAVYIGAPRFSARQMAGNALDDIRELVQKAHFFNVRVYVTVNTIFSDEELEDVRRLITDLYEMGVDALIIQDLGILEMRIPPIELHASTQMDNRSSEKVAFLHKAGLEQVVLARELSLEEIRKIHNDNPQVRLEAFCHGALCVSYSGQCYASQSCYHRSANRGACAQFCRLAFDLEDAMGRKAVNGRHLLSLKDLCQIDNLEEMIDAGISSLKIEGRLKDSGYVKNITAAYRKRLDQIIARREDLERPSWGESILRFEPQVQKSFNRGHTSYFLHGRGEEIASIQTPKSIGEEMGVVKSQRGKLLVVAGIKPFHNGDGICYFDESGRLVGLRVNRVDGNHLYLQQAPACAIPLRTRIFRNLDQEFEQTLSGETAIRRIALRMSLRSTQDGLALTLKEKTPRALEVTVTEPMVLEKARNFSLDYLRSQLSRLGDTLFAADSEDIEIQLEGGPFIPASQLAVLRRKAIEALERLHRITYRLEPKPISKTSHPFMEKELTYLGNVMNHKAVRFLERHGVEKIEPAMELRDIKGEHLIMTTRHCIRFLMGWCPKRQKTQTAFKEPFFLVSSDKRRFRLAFDCRNCQMQVYSAR